MSGRSIAMEVRWGWGAASLCGAMWVLLVVEVICVGAAVAPVLKAGETPVSALEAVSDTLDLLKQRMGWKADEVKLGSIDTRDAKIGQTLIYEFDIQVGGVVIPLRLSEEVTSWQYLQELPAPSSDAEDNEDGKGGGKQEVKKGAVNVWHPEAFAATLAPFEVAGPVDLWIQDAEELRLAMPHDVDAGVLKRVLLADGAVVSVQGAREVSLSRPLQLPLPLPRGPDGGLAASLVALAARLRSASRGQEKPLLSLRIVGPSSLTAVKTPAESSPGRLKVKRLGSGAVELTSAVAKKVESKPMTVPYGPLAVTDNIEDLYMWPLPHINMSKLEGLEQALMKILGKEAYRRGSFQLLKAKVSAASFVQIGFEVDKSIDKDAFEDDELWPEWATKPSIEHLQFELLTIVEGKKLRPVQVQQSESVMPTIAVSPNVVDGNLTFGTVPFFDASRCHDSRC